MIKKNKSRFIDAINSPPKNCGNSYFCLNFDKRSITWNDFETNVRKVYIIFKTFVVNKKNFLNGELLGLISQNDFEEQNTKNQKIINFSYEMGYRFQ